MSSDVLIGVRRVSNMGGRIESADTTITLRDQETRLHSAAAAVGKRIGKIVDAIDQSGFTMASSDMMDTILADIERGEAGGVAFGYFERSGRNWWEQGPFFSRLERAEGLFVVSGMEAVDYRTPQGRQFFGMQAITSEGAYWSAKEKSEGVLSAMMTRKVPNAIPYGYQRNGTYIDGQLARKLDPERDGKALVKAETIDVVQRIYELRLDGYGHAAIAHVLNDEGVPGPRGGLWTPTTVRTMLANPIYRGDIVQGRRHPKRRPGTAATIRTTHDATLAIVTVDQWRRAQSTRKQQRTGTHRAGVAGGVLICSGCGRALKVVGSGDGRFHYGCPRVSTKGRCARPVYVAKKVADAYVDQQVSRALEGLEVGSVVASSRRLELAEQRVAQAQENLDLLPDQVPPSHAKFRDYFERYDAELTEALAEREAAAGEQHERQTLPTAPNYRKAPLERRNRIARLLLRVEVAPPVSRSKLAPILDRFTADWH